MPAFGLSIGSALAQVGAPPDSISVDVDGAIPIRLQQRLHADAGVRIDGHLNDDAWGDIDPFGVLKVIEPDTLDDVPYGTDLRMFYTERGVYVSFDMEQPQDTIIKRYVPRDDRDVSRDRVGFTLDTSGDGRYGYWMNVSLGDSEMDGTLLPEREYGSEWDGAWYGATQQTDRGWSAEFFVPWSQMAMPKRDGMRRIGLYVSRSVAHLNQRWGWPALPSTQSRFISRFQPLELTGVDPRQQWSIFPYASATQDQIDKEQRYKAGADLFWRPSTNFQLTATINPDFGSIESDNVVVNLTANETFFPEKRLFFQEGADIFDLGGGAVDFGPPPITIVNTRRIGGRPRDLDLPDGVGLPRRESIKPADIITAAKATGQIGRLRYGVLTAFEDDTDYLADDGLAYSQPGRDFGAFRVLYEDSVGAAYRGLGWITTLVAHPESDAVVHGGDFHYLTTSGRWNFNGQVLFSDRDEAASGFGGSFDVTYTPRQGLKHTFQMTSLDDAIDVNDLGFQIRNDADDFRYRMEWNKSGLSRVRNFRLAPFLRYEVNDEGFRTNNAIATDVSVTLNNLTTLGGFFGFAPRRYDDRNSFGNGTFSVRPRWFGNVNFSTDPSKPFRVEGRLNYRGEFVFGQNLEKRLTLGWRPRDNLGIELEIQHGEREGWLLHQADRDFTAFDAETWQPKLNVEFFSNGPPASAPIHAVGRNPRTGGSFLQPAEQ